MEALLPYLPIDRLHALAGGHSLPEQVHGAALFADISGFTPLTEALTRSLGPRLGVEELTQHLNRVYDALIDEVHRFGGSVLNFAGDAITCWFDGDDGRRALASALAMQTAMQRLEHIRLPDGEVATLAVKASIAVGPARRMAVGDPVLHLIDVLAGETLLRMGDGGHVAARGEVIVDAASLAALDGVVNLAGWREYHGKPFGIVRALQVEVEPTPWPQPPHPAEAAVLPWLLPPIHRRLRAGQGEFLTELRPAVPLFTKFGEIDFDHDPQAAAKLNAYVTFVQQTLDRHHGFLIDMSIGDKGCCLCSAFGAPLAQEDDPLRALSAVLEVRRRPRELDFIDSVQMGLSLGTMRTGAYGSASRRTYGVMGDEVNLAARLMERAQPGEILVSETLQARAAREFRWEVLEPFKAKGKSQPVRVFGLVDSQTASTSGLVEPTSALPLVGRRAELDLLRRLLEQTRTGRGQVLGITAEAGMGKSRLVAEFVRQHVDERVTVLAGQCQSSGVRTSYLVWWSVFRALFDVPEDADGAVAVQALTKYLSAANPAWLPRLPLLGAVLNLPLPDNELTAGFDAKLRKTSLEGLLVDCLRQRARQRPILAVLDDCHWIDPLSLDLAEAIARSSSDVPILLAACFRPPHGAEGDRRAFSGLSHFTGIELGTFSREEGEAFLKLKTAQLFGPQGSLPPAFAEQLLARAEGNPFYLEELLQYLHDQRVSLEADEALKAVELPGTLHSLILSRIDRLSESQKVTLKVASVIGRVFPADLVAEVQPQRESQTVRGDLHVLQELDLTPCERVAPELTYLFKHVVTQEVAYESLSYATRAGLHNAIGLRIEQLHADALEQQVSLLAFHFARSRNDAKKLEYLLRAGDAARTRYANAAAIDCYERALPLLDPARRIPVLLNLGTVMELVGRWQDADRVYTEALQFARDHGALREEAQSCVALGELSRKRGDFAAVVTWLSRARQLYEQLHDPAGVAETLHVAGNTAALQGRYDEASQSYYESMFLRRQLGDDAKTGSLLSNLGIMAYFRGDLLSARFFYESSLRLRRRVGERRAVANSLNNLGLVLGAERDFAGARRLIEESLSLSRELGDRWSAANSLCSLAETALDQGDHTATRAYLLDSFKLNRRLGDRTAIAFVLEISARLAAATGQARDALQLAAAARALRESIGSPLSPAEQERLEQALAGVRHEVPEDERAVCEARARSEPAEELFPRIFHAAAAAPA